MNLARSLPVSLIISLLFVATLFSSWLRWGSVLIVIATAGAYFLFDSANVEIFLCKVGHKNPSFHTTRLTSCTIHYSLDENRTKELKTDRTIVIIPDPPMTIEHYTKSHITDDLKVGNSAIIVMEAPGFGFSIPHNGFSFSWESYTDTLVEFLKQINRPPYVIITSSILGLVAVKVAEQLPKKVSHLVLQQCPVYKDASRWAKSLDAGGFLSTPIVGQLALYFRRQFVTKVWCNRTITNRPCKALIYKHLLEAQERGSLFSVATAFQHLFYEQRNTPSFEPVNQPALLLWGGNDKTHRKTNKKGVIQYFNSQVEYRELPNLGHFVDLEEPGEFVKYVRDFLDKEQ